MTIRSRAEGYLTSRLPPHSQPFSDPKIGKKGAKQRLFADAFRKRGTRQTAAANWMVRGNFFADRFLARDPKRDPGRCFDVVSIVATTRIAMLT